MKIAIRAESVDCPYSICGLIEAIGKIYPDAKVFVVSDNEASYALFKELKVDILTINPFNFADTLGK